MQHSERERRKVHKKRSHNTARIKILYEFVYLKKKIYVRGPYKNVVLRNNNYNIELYQESASECESLHLCCLKVPP